MAQDNNTTSTLLNPNYSVKTALYWIAQRDADTATALLYTDPKMAYADPKLRNPVKVIG